MKNYINYNKEKIYNTHTLFDKFIELFFHFHSFNPLTMTPMMNLLPFLNSIDERLLQDKTIDFYFLILNKLINNGNKLDFYLFIFLIYFIFVYFKCLNEIKQFPKIIK